MDEIEPFLTTINKLPEEQKNTILDYIHTKLDNLKIQFQEIPLKPEQIHTGTVKKSGNGASIQFKKKYIGQQVYIILKN